MNKIKYKFNNTNFSVFLRDDVDLSVFNEIFKYREYKQCEEKIIQTTFPIIDIGAHVGFFSIYANCFNKNVKIYAIEPEKNNLEFLSLNKKENKIENIKIIEGAIGRESGEGELILSGDSINHKIQKQKTKNKNEENIQKIKIFCLKDFLNKNKIEKVSLIKMDIEGGEYEIIENLEEDFFNRIEAFILEYHIESSKFQVPNSKLGEERDEKYLERILRENGFSVQIFPSRFDKNMGFVYARNKKFKN